MSKIIACVDGSNHQKSVCDFSSWISKNTKLEISLLHVAKPHDEFEAKGNLSGAIGLGSTNVILEELSEQDEEHGKCEQKKGEKILKTAQQQLAANDVKDSELFHRRGTLSEAISDLADEAKIVVIGKKGEESGENQTGSNLEDVISNAKHPILVVPQKSAAVKSFLIAYDGSDHAKKALDFVCKDSLLKGLNCHLLKVDQESGDARKVLSEAEGKLKKAEFKVISSLKEGKSIEGVVNSYIVENDIDLLAIGAYGHSKIRKFFLGSTTNALIAKTQVPVLLFK